MRLLEFDKCFQQTVPDTQIHADLQKVTTKYKEGDLGFKYDYKEVLLWQ